MRISILATITAALLPTTILGCKCIDKNGGQHADATSAACKILNGTFRDNDCAASSISEKLSNFHYYCKVQGWRSDCRCPSGCREAPSQEEIEKFMAGLGKDTKGED
ncbi:hypothetical protein P280DRAFT_466044 [Massarina eburnea CBS 473.64]|uniref:Uncharacterized protein n=1 Tax=Massarina eburnea CBS 473.64 TaxID=1395130 RepID=A0A6A6SBY3_9PLEO|nr:hypothetical protein P280DRAFT_466044 [Massarina eburnea CBS 473.64]